MYICVCKGTQKKAIDIIIASKFIQRGKIFAFNAYIEKYFCQSSHLHTTINYLSKNLCYTLFFSKMELSTNSHIICPIVI